MSDRIRHMNLLQGSSTTRIQRVSKSRIASYFGSALAPAAIALALLIAAQAWLFIGMDRGESASYWFTWRGMIIFGGALVAGMMLLTHGKALIPTLLSGPVILSLVIAGTTVIGSFLALRTSETEQVLIGISQFGWGLYAALAMPLVLFTIFAAARESSKARSWIVTIVAVSAIAQALMAIIQATSGSDPLEPLHMRQLVSQIHGASGRDDYLALVLTPFVMLMIVRLTQVWGVRRWSRALPVAGLLLALTLAVNYASNRAAVISIAASIVFVLLSGLWRSWRAWVTGASVLALLFTPLPRGTSSGELALSDLSTNLNTLETRAALWSASLRNVTELPLGGLFGLGPTGFSIAQRDYVDLNDFVDVYNMEYGYRVTDPVFVRSLPNPEPLWTNVIIADAATPNDLVPLRIPFGHAHNAVIDKLYEGGPIAAFAWVLLFLGGVWTAWRRGNIGLSAAVLSAFVAYQALFPVNYIDPTMYTLVALAWASPKRGNEDGPAKPPMSDDQAMQSA